LSSRRFAVIVRLCLCLSAVAAVLLTSVPAAAQESRPGRPYRGLFGPEERNAARVLAVNGQVGSGYETGVLVERRQIDEIDLNIENSSFFESESVFSLFSGGISYVDHTDRLDFNAAFQSTARDYSRFAMVSSHTGSTGLTARLGRRTTVSWFGTASYQPWGAIIYSVALTDPAFAQVVEPTRQIPVVNGSYKSYASGASIAQQMFRRSTVMAGYTYDLADFSGLAGDYQHQEAWVRYTQGLTRNLGWHAGYSYSEARFRNQPTNSRARGRGFDLGLDYNRSLSLTRRTQFGFRTGMAAIDSNVELPTGFQGTQYSATGGAWLNHEIGRTWDAVVSYSRNVAFFESLRAPYFYDGVNVGLNGLISRRVGFRSAAGVTYGDVGLTSGTRDANRFVTGVADATLTIAISRYAAIAAQYAFYTYSVDDANAFWMRYAPDMHRHVALVSLRAWAPIIERGRRGNATR
jgi:hypothetical protein